jgi:hypothetical protein
VEAGFGTVPLYCRIQMTLTANRYWVDNPIPSISHILAMFHFDHSYSYLSCFHFVTSRGPTLTILTSTLPNLAGCTLAAFTSVSSTEEDTMIWYRTRRRCDRYTLRT